MLGQLRDLNLWPHTWPWPWIFKVKFWNSCISVMRGQIDMEGEGCEWIRCENHYVTVDCDLDLDLKLKGYKSTVLYLLCRAGVLLISSHNRSTQVLNFWYLDFTHTCAFQSNIVLMFVLVLWDKYSGTHMSTGLSTDILWYIWDEWWKPSYLWNKQLDFT